MNIFQRKIRTIATDIKGVAAIEFALVLPLLLFLLLGGVEMWRYIDSHQRVEKAVYQIANVVSQTDFPSQNVTLDDLQTSYNTLVGRNASDGRFVVSIITRPDTANADDDSIPPAEVRYQWSNGLASRYGGEGAIVGETVSTIDLTSRDILVAVEASQPHKNLLADTMFNIGNIATRSSASTNVNNNNISRESIVVFRQGIALDQPDPDVEADLPPEPVSCGYYTEADRTNSNSAYEQGVQKYSFLFDGNYDKINDRRDGFSSVADVPHPCACYADTAAQFKGPGVNIQLAQKLASCNPELTGSNSVGCPSWTDNANTNDNAFKVYNPLYEPVHPLHDQLINEIGFDEDREYLPQVFLKCEAGSTQKEKDCNGYITENDLYEPGLRALDFEYCPNNKPRNKGNGGGSKPDPLPDATPNGA